MSFKLKSPFTKHATPIVNMPMEENVMGRADKRGNILINKHQTTHPQLFEYFLERYQIINAWGNEIKLNDSLNYHTHPCWHGVLYLTKGCDLNLPELNLKITPSINIPP